MQLLERVWKDLAAAIGPLGALAILLAYLFFRAYMRQSRWTQEYLVKIIERNTAAQVLATSRVEQVSNTLPAGGNASPGGSSPAEPLPTTTDCSASTPRPPRRTYAC